MIKSYVRTIRIRLPFYPDLNSFEKNLPITSILKEKSAETDVGFFGIRMGLMIMNYFQREKTIYGKY